MSTVIEVRGRGKQLIERCRTDQQTIRIGRAFDNDVILEDSHISAHHLTLQQTEQGWQVEDLNSLNGVSLKGARGEPVSQISSGDALLVGNLALYVYSSDHPVEPAQKTHHAEKTLLALGRFWVWPLLVMASVALSYYKAYQQTVVEFKPLTQIQPSLETVMAVAAIAIVWALVGRLLRHRAYFFAHLSIWFIVIFAEDTVVWLIEVLSYNISSADLQNWLVKVVTFVSTAVAVWASLMLATTMRSKLRIWSAIGVAMAFVLVDLSSQLRFEREFSPNPQYFSAIKRPGLLIVPASQPDEVQPLLDGLFDKADEEAEKEL